jgi:hypothetical protein
MLIGVVVIGVITFYMGFGVGYLAGKVSKTTETKESK